MRLDFHTHAFHPKIAARVLNQLRSRYDISPVGTGLSEDLHTRIRAAGLDRAVVHTAATRPAQVIPANNWALHLAREHPWTIPFGTIHPGYHDFEAELERLKGHGIRGIKLHPGFQGFDLADPRLVPVFAAMKSHFVVLVHIGDDQPPDTSPSSPYKLLAIHERFPQLPLVAAHFGGARYWQSASEAILGTAVCVDTSSSLAFIPDPMLDRIFSRHPLERIFFGSDYPLFDPSRELALLRDRLKLTSEQTDTLLTAGGRLLGLGSSSLSKEGKSVQ
ncbi:MAG: amidohydrolase family protein [Desulfovibrionales bacterium]